MTGIGDPIGRNWTSPWVRNLRQPQLGVCVLVPALGPRPVAAADSLAGIFVRSLRLLAARLTGVPLLEERIWLGAFDAPANAIVDLSCLWRENAAGETASAEGRSAGGDLQTFVRDLTGRLLTGHETPGVLLFVSPSYLLREDPRPEKLLRRACRDGLACCGSADGDLYAAAVALPVRESRWSKLPGLLRRLSSPLSAKAAPPDGDLRGIAWEPVDSSGPTGSPSLSGIAARVTTRPFDAPPAVNVALAEAIFFPADRSPIGADAERLRSALIGQRERSAAPWIVNELLNEVECGMGHRQPESIPPEFHISISGACNIECGFCSYSHKAARNDRVAVSQVLKLAFLRHVRTLRLHSGNGEPTVNPALAEIIRYVAKAFPQISMNFFTNGVLLDRPGLIATLVGSQVAWISVSINSTTREGWKKLCRADHFDRISRNLIALREEKRARSANCPVVYGSMVLTRETVHELPQMPELCRRLGIDRFTAIPFFALGYKRPDRLQSEDAYHHINSAYDAIYARAVAEAERCQVSIELPMPRAATIAAYGVEKRAFHDFARIEPHDARVGKLLGAFSPTPPFSALCRHLWCQAAVGSTSREHGEAAGTHFLYPCLGPLAALNLAPHTAFRFPGEDGFKALWRNPLFTTLRDGQLQPGLVAVCDTCRGSDSRAPASLPSVEAMLGDFARRQGI